MVERSGRQLHAVTQRVKRFSRFASLQAVHNRVGMTHYFIEDCVLRSECCERAAYLKFRDPNRDIVPTEADLRAQNETG
jgi:hypothetical protein